MSRSFRLQTIWGVGISLLLVAAATWLNSRVLGANGATAALAYLLCVLTLAVRCGLTESLVASAASVLCYNYFFLPPIGTFTIADPENWVALVTFLATATTTSHLSAKARRQAVAALTRQREVERLYGLSHTLLLIDLERNITSQLVQRVRESFGLREAAFFDLQTGNVISTSPAEGALPDVVRLRGAAETGIEHRERQAAVLPVTLGGSRLGALWLLGEELSDAALQAIANLAAVTIERGRTHQAASHAAAVRQSEALKATLLDALAHEFKTPLTSIKVATSTVRSRAHDAVEQEMLDVIGEETDRLNQLVSESIEMARLEPGRIRLRRTPCAVGVLIGDALQRLHLSLEQRPVHVELPAHLPLVEVDESLMGLVLRQLLGNALRYSEPGTALRIEAQQEDGDVTLRIIDQGRGIAAEEQQRIFERYYRGQDHRDRVAGSGLGLAIARDVVAAHSGRIWVESTPGQGATFALVLPAAGRRAA